MNTAIYYSSVIFAGLLVQAPIYVAIHTLHLKSGELGESKNYFEAVEPLIGLSIFVLAVIAIQLIDLVKVILDHGLQVCHRDNLGVYIQKIVIHGSVLMTLCHLHTYLKQGGLNFIDVFHPLFILSIMILLRIMCCKLSTSVELAFMNLCLYAILFVGFCLFDKPESNVHNYDPPYWHFAVPVSGLLLCEAWLNLKEY